MLLHFLKNVLGHCRFGKINIKNILDYGRSADLTSITEYDSDELIAAKKGIEEWITKFVNEVTPGPKAHK